MVAPSNGAHLRLECPSAPRQVPAGNQGPPPSHLAPGDPPRKQPLPATSPVAILVKNRNRFKMVAMAGAGQKNTGSSSPQGQWGWWSTGTLWPVQYGKSRGAP